MREQLLKNAKRIVVKIGSNLVATRDRGLRLDQIDRLSREMASFSERQREVVIVSSGAILAGIEKLGLKSYPQTLPLKQACAATGQSQLIHAYEKSFGALGRTVAQILLTHQDLAHRRRFLNARHTLTALLQYGVIPIVNENDTVSVEEIRFGDNDTLASQVAHLVDADLLMILSDVDGLYSEDPRLNPKASLLSCIETITEDIIQCAGPSQNEVSTGGMATKVQAAQHAAQFGVPTFITNGEKPGRLESLFTGESSKGTLFYPKERRLPSRKNWIAYTLRPKGQIVLDDGAVEALKHRGKSLLPSGIIQVTGNFFPGDPVVCTDANGKEFAKGLVNYSADRLQKIKGHRTADIQHILGTQEYEEIIHRDNLALL